jgi:hypothetical protein
MDVNPVRGRDREREPERGRTIHADIFDRLLKGGAFRLRDCRIERGD